MKTIFIAITCLANLGLYAQAPEDALRYSWITQNGTARNQAIGGASGSLGGEFSTLFNNPAGIGFYKTNEVVLTPGFTLQNNKATYNNQVSTTNKKTLMFGSSGFIFSTPYSQKRKVRNLTIALGINQSANFNSNTYYKGYNNQSSYSEKYLDELKSNNVTDPNHAATDFPFGSSLAINTYLIDTVNVNGVITYKSLAPIGTGLLQENNVVTSGAITDLTLGAAVNLRDKLFLGATITVPLLNFNRSSQYTESDATKDTTNHFNFFQENETLKTTGFGVGMKLGLIYKPVEYVRLGLALHSPTYYQVTDQYTTTLMTDLENYGGAGIKTQSSDQFTNNVPGESKYSLLTPWRAIASASYVFREVENVKRQRAFITADLEYVNYKSARFNSTDGNPDTKSYYSAINALIKDQYKGALNARVGGELKFNTIMFRLGAAYYGDPYKDDKADKIKLSGGLGYRDKGIFIDLTYVYAMNKDVNYPYRLVAKVNNPAAIQNNTGNIVLTVGFKLWPTAPY